MRLRPGRPRNRQDHIEPHQAFALDIPHAAVRDIKQSGKYSTAERLNSVMQTDCRTASYFYAGDTVSHGREMPGNGRNLQF